MIVRTYDPSYFGAVLALIEAASDHDRTQRVSDGALRSVTFALNLSGQHPYETTALVFLEKYLAGFAWWERSAPHQIKFDGWVHPAHRRKGAGTALLVAVERYAREQIHGATIQSRNYEDIPGVAEMFARRGFALARRFHVMTTTLTGRTFHVQPPPGVCFRTFERENLDALVEADNQFFVGHWGSEPRSVNSWARNMLEMRPHDPALWVIGWQGNEIVAECLCHLSREAGPKDGWVSTLGVHPAWRGRGLGRAILIAGLQKLQEAGYETASLNVDSENISAVNLYRSVEMDVARTRLHFSKLVEPPNLPAR